MPEFGHAPPAGRLPWWLTPQLATVALLHTAALVALLAAPPHWPAVLGVVLAFNLVIFIATLWPRSRLLGPNLLRLPAASAARGEIALTFDDGPNPAITPAVLDLLDTHGAKATFFCIARHAEAQAGLCREILRRGHAVENHSLAHRHHFAALGPAGYLHEIRDSQQVLTQACGVHPVFFRAPAGFRNPFLWVALRRYGLTLASWTRRGFDTTARDPAIVRTRLLRGLRAGDILLLHDGQPGRSRSGRPIVFDVLPDVLAAIQGAGLKPVTLRTAFDLAPATPG